MMLVHSKNGGPMRGFMKPSAWYI